MPKRGINIYKRKDGRWEGRVKREGNLMHKTQYISIYGKTYSEVKTKMNEVKREQLKGQGKCAYTIEEAVSIWLEDRRPFWKPGTYATYKQLAEKHILPDIGKYKIDRFGNHTLEDYIIEKRKENQCQPLSETYLHNICSVILQSLCYLKKKYNFDLVIPDAPKIKSASPKVQIPAEKNMDTLEKYLLANTADDTCLGILLAFYTGIRLGELCALTWSAIDLENGILHIKTNLQRVRLFDGQKTCTQVLVQTPKTSSSIRLIPIPQTLLGILKDHRRENNDFIIAGVKNKWAEPRTVQYRFERILQNCEIPYFNFHLLRHAFATKCISRGFDVKSLSELLGHSNIQITLDLYVHSSLQQKQQLMNLLDTKLFQQYTATNLS